MARDGWMSFPIARLCFSVLEKHKRDVFSVTFCGVQKVTKRDGFYVLFAFSKKNQKDDFLLLFASAKSNQKQTEGCGPLDSRGAVQNPCGGFLRKNLKC